MIYLTKHFPFIIFTKCCYSCDIIEMPSFYIIQTISKKVLEYYTDANEAAFYHEWWKVFISLINCNQFDAYFYEILST